MSILGLSAWTYHVPGVQNPNALGQTARLRYDDLWDYGAAVMVTVPFR